MITQFRPIEGFEELYEIDNDGRVYSHKTNKILKICLDYDGYGHVDLYKDKKHNRKSVHRLVAEAFLPNQLGLPCVNHKDENKLNNHVELELDKNGNIVVNEEKSNLEWCTVKYNNNYNDRQKRIAAKKRGVFKHSEESKRKISASKKGKPIPKKRKPVVAVKDGVVVMEFTSIAEAERNGFIQSKISLCCLGKRKTHGGYQWFFKSDWEEMQKNKAKPVKRELPYQLSLQFD